MWRRFGVPVAALLIAASCGVNADGPPAIVVDRTPCSHCGMLISETVFAAAYRSAGEESRVFDDIGCLLDALQRRGGPDVRIWVHDAAGGGWIDGEAAVYVRSPSIRTPMNGGVLAYRASDAAEQAAVKHHGDVVRSLAALRSRGSAR
jgi:nitrous oxide reductase accessory protein NosL